MWRMQTPIVVALQHSTGHATTIFRPTGCKYARMRLVAQTDPMGFGVRLRMLWKLRAAVAACVLLSFVAGLSSVQRISLQGLTPRSLEVATASTQVVIDTPKSAMLDLRQDTYSLEGLTNRAVLLGNVMASSSVRASIAQRANVPVDALLVSAPLTPKQPRAIADEGNTKRTSDIFKLHDEYRLNIQANPTAPVLHIYAQTPTAKSADALANAAVDSMRAYLEELAREEQTPMAEQIRLIQLGRAQGAVINGGVQWQVAILAFFLTLAASCATLILIARVAEGWHRSALADRLARG